MSMDCNETKRFLDAYVDGELELTRQLDMEAHLAACPRCKNAVEAAIDFRFSIPANIPVYKAPPEQFELCYEKNLDPGSNGFFSSGDIWLARRGFWCWASRSPGPGSCIPTTKTEN